MSTSIGELFLKLRVDGGDQFKSVMAEAKGYMLAFGAAAAATGAAAIKMASDFSETSNVIQQAFGGGAAAAEQWAATTGAALGRSTQAMRETVSVMQAMLSPMVGNQDAAAGMSKALAQLAVDMGSFWNVADTQAFDALRSAMSGESEPMKRFGVVMTEAALNAYALSNGINMTTQQMTESEKATLRFHYVMEQTSMVQGDAARTSDGFANQLKALQADASNAAVTLGNDLMPAARDWLAFARQAMSIMSGGGVSEALGAVNSVLKTMADLALQAVQGWLMLARLLSQKPWETAGAESSLDGLIDKVTRLRDALANPSTPGGGGGKYIAGETRITGGADGRSTVTMVNGRPVLNAADFGGGDDSSGGGSGRAKSDPKWKWSGDNNALMKSFDEWFSGAAQDTQRAVAPFNAALSMSVAGLANLNGAYDRSAKEAAYRDEKERLRQEESARKRDAAFAASAVGAARMLASGDIGGAAGGMGMALLGKAKGFDAVAGPVGGLVSWATDNIKAAVDFIIGGIKKGFGMVFDALATFGPRDGRIKGFMGTVGGAVAAGAPIHASPLGVISIPVTAALGLGAALLKLSQETEGYGRFQKALTAGTSEVVKALEPFWQNMMPVAGAFIMLSKSVGVLAGALMPGGSAVEWFATQALEAARGMSSIILGIFQVSLAFADARLSILEFAESIVPGSQFADSLAAASRAHGDAEEKVRQAAALREQLGKMTLDELGALAGAASGTAESFRALNSTLTNIPSGFKGMAAAMLGAMDPTGDPMAGGGDGMSATGRRQTDMEGRGREAGFSGERGVTVNGNVTIVANNTEEFQRQMERKQFIQSGTPLTGIASYMNRS